MNTIRANFRLAPFGYGLFWSWNLIFLAFMGLGFAPMVLPPLIDAARFGEVPGEFVVYAGVLTLIPLLAVGLGLTVLRREPKRLLALGYGVEGPLMLLLALRFFMVRELTLVMGVLLAVAGLGVLTFLWTVLDRRPEARGAGLKHARGFGLTLAALTGVYAGLWIAFYAVPLAAWGLTVIGELFANLGQVVREWVRELVTGNIAWLPFSVLGLMLTAYSATLFIGMPVVVPALYGWAWWRGMRTLAGAAGRVRATGVALAAAVAAVGGVALAAPQPQQAAFDLLARPPATPAEAQALRAQEAALRTGLLNAYLAPFRYVSAVGELTHVREMYIGAVGLSSDQAATVQGWYETLTRPLLYVPATPGAEVEASRAANANWVFQREPAAAEALYRQYFDRPINKGEREAVIRAAQSSWSPDQARAAVQAVDDREVRLTQQALTITEHGDWAEVELYEVYQNVTFQRQEVVYYFSLPETAVVTGLWLGNSEDRAARFVYHVAPRGAAQAVYQSQVRRNLDPALVEQIGPRQYRLRIFPIEPMGRTWEGDGLRSTVQAAPPLHLWLTYRVLAAGQAWPLPRLAARFNVFWDAATTRTLNGAPMAVSGDAWLPATAAAQRPVTPAAHQVTLATGQAVSARPATAATPVAAGLRLAVVVDRSRSMAEQAGEVRQALARLRELGAAADVYLTTTPYHGEAPRRVTLAEAEPEAWLYAGGQHAAELLAQFEALRAGDRYAAILVLTDGAGYELGPSPVPLAAPGVPLWMVHLGGVLPLGYDDATLEAIQASGGGAAASVDEALLRLGAGAEGDVVDGYVWEVGPAAGAADPDFAPLAARHLILATLPDPRLAAERLTVLDNLHALAKEAGIVTPYSSMIVLVNAEQERMLREAEQRADRFDREFEEVGETEPVNVTGVPEPEEWLLIALAGVMLAVYWWRRPSPRMAMR